MININISKQILTVGCAYHKPKGGVAQVLYNYKQYVFPQFKSVINSGGDKKWYKLLKAIGGLCLLGVLLVLDRNIKIVHIHTASYNSFRISAGM